MERRGERGWEAERVDRNYEVKGKLKDNTRSDRREVKA